MKDKEDAIKQKDSNQKKITELLSKDKEKSSEAENLQIKIQNADKEMQAAKDEKRKVAVQMKEAIF